MTEEKGQTEIVFTEKDMLEMSGKTRISTSRDFPSYLSVYKAVLKYNEPAINSAVKSCGALPMMPSEPEKGVGFLVLLESEKITKIEAVNRIGFSDLKKLHSKISCKFCTYCFEAVFVGPECRYFPPQVVRDSSDHNSRYPSVTQINPCSKFERSEDSIFRAINILNKGNQND